MDGAREAGAAKGASEVTRLLAAARAGDRDAYDRLLPLVYDDLRRIARAQLRGRPGHTLGATGIVHEAYLKLVDGSGATPADRAHFFALAARAMRQVLVSYARERAAAKRGGPARPVTLEEDRVGAGASGASAASAAWLLDVDRALERLARRDERLARVVECRFFAGLTEDETAEALGSSVRTVQRDWMRARAWLREELGGGLP